MRRLALLVSVIVVAAFNGQAFAGTASAVLSSDLSSANAPTAELMGTGLFESVDWINVGPGWNSGSTPTLTEIEGYDSLLVYSELPFDDRDALSAALKDYVDGGGHVVLAAYDFTDNTNSYYAYAIGEAGVNAGILTPGYSPFKPVMHANSNPTSGDVVALSPGDAIFDGVSIDGGGLLDNFGYYSNNSFVNPILDSGAELLADDGAGTNMIARNTAGNVVGLNLFASNNTENTGDFFRLVANAMQPVPEPGSVAVWTLLGFCMIFVARRRFVASR